jgi:3D (Asp-Asp-Asp) domain-containing protein
MASWQSRSAQSAALFRAAPVSVWAGVIAVILLIGLELLAVVAVVNDTDGAPMTLMALNTAPTITPPPMSAATESLAMPAIEPQTRIDPAPVAPSIAHTPDAPPPPDAANYFGTRPIRHVRTIRMLVTAYSPDEKSCGKFADNITASGYSVWTNGMKLAAADTDLLPFGTVITIPGYNGGRPVPVLDRGGKIKGSRIDVLYPTHEIARGWGAQWLDVDVWEYAD